MLKVFLNIGSNIERENNIRSGLKNLTEVFGELDVSSIYESEPVGFEGACFYNLAVSFETDLSLSDIILTLKSIEDRHGRVRGGKHFAPRTLDIDVVCYGDVVGEREAVELPRPELYYNAFVLWPMAELAPTNIDPKTGQSYKVLWDKKRREIELKQKVWRIDERSAKMVLDL